MFIFYTSQLIPILLMHHDWEHQLVCVKADHTHTHTHTQDSLFMTVAGYLLALFDRHTHTHTSLYMISPS